MGLRAADRRRGGNSCGASGARRPHGARRQRFEFAAADGGQPLQSRFRGRPPLSEGIDPWQFGFSNQRAAGVATRRLGGRKLSKGAPSAPSSIHDEPATFFGEKIRIRWARSGAVNPPAQERRRQARTFPDERAKKRLFDAHARRPEQHRTEPRALRLLDAPAGRASWRR